MMPRVHPATSSTRNATYSGVPLEAFLQPVHHVGFVLLMLFFFMAFSRIMDVMLPIARLPLLTSLVVLLCMVLRGGLMRVWQAVEGKMLLGFTAWCIVCIPFSSWRGGSFATVKDEWLKSLICFMLVVGLTVTLRQVRRLMVTIAFATLLLTLMALVKQHRTLGRLSFDVGMFSNPNDLAQALLLGVPLLFALNLPQSNVFYRLLTAAAAAPMILATIETGSRAAILAMLLMLLMVFVRVGYMGKLVLTLVIAAGGIVAVMVVPDAIRNRLTTVMGSQQEEAYVAEQEDVAAVASAESRKELFLQSIRFTIQHPLFGVGPGTFQHASVAETTSIGERGMWRQTHNMYTQISSECGLPGFALYFGTVFVLFWKFRSLRKMCGNDPRLDEVRKMLLIYSTSFVSVLVTGTFSSVGYQLLLPSMIGIATVLHRAGLQEVMRIRGTAPAAGAPIWYAEPRRTVQPARTKPVLTSRTPRF